MNWIKVSSVTPGGKPHFFRAYDSENRWMASIVWNRIVQAYAVEVSKPSPRLIGYVSTVLEGKVLAERMEAI